MSNNKDFKVKNGIQPTAYHEGLGTVTSGGVGYYLAGASLTNSFSVSGQDGTPKSVALSSDGTKMFVLGYANDRIYEYTLSTAWDLTTASYVDFFSVSGQMTAPFGMDFKPDGTKVFVVGNNTASVYQYSLSTAWDISTASYDSKSFSFATQDAIPYDVTFNDAGTKVYMVGTQNDNFYQYSLSTAWDVSTASYDSVSVSVSIAESEISGQGIHITDSDTKVFFFGGVNDKVYRLDLSTAGDLSTASWSGQGVLVADGNSGTPFIADSGTRMYITGTSNDTVYQYSTVLYTETLDLSTGSVFEVTPTSDIQVTLSNPADSGTVSQATLLLSAVGTEYTITYDTAVEWPGGTAPTSPASGETDVLTFNTRDGGTTYQGVLAIDGAQ